MLISEIVRGQTAQTNNRQDFFFHGYRYGNFAANILGDLTVETIFDNLQKRIIHDQWLAG